MWIIDSHIQFHQLHRTTSASLDYCALLSFKSKKKIFIKTLVYVHFYYLMSECEFVNNGLFRLKDCNRKILHDTLGFPFEQRRRIGPPTTDIFGSCQFFFGNITRGIPKRWLDLLLTARLGWARIGEPESLRRRLWVCPPSNPFVCNNFRSTRTSIVTRTRYEYLNI